jgi:hypothetical protein
LIIYSSRDTAWAASATTSVNKEIVYYDHGSISQIVGTKRENVALQEAKEALALRDTAVAEAAQDVSCEDYMLDLLTDASLDMAGVPLEL